MGEFGDKFRKAREKKEFSLDDVSNVTKIGSRMLQAIEEEHFDQLPGGVFNKGFIRAYAKHLGLNDEEAVSDYLACLRQAQIDAHEVWDPQRPASPRPAAPRSAAPVKQRPVEPRLPAAKSSSPAPVEELPELQLPRAEDVRPRRQNFAQKSLPEIPWRILALAAIVVVLTTILWTRHSRSTGTAAASSSPAKIAQPAPAQAAPVPVPASTSTPDNPMSSSLPASTPAPQLHPSIPNSPPPQATASATSPPSGNSAPATTPASDADEKNDVTIRSFAKSNPQPPAKSVPSLTLVIRATETSWISVLADGQSVSQETLIAPAHTSVRATREIVAKIGNAAGVTFLWNGQEIPADGAEAEVKTFVFDSNGMHVVPPTSAPTP
ncbi:MAG: RodZ domain-containing protein [Candidatus Sulfotelmatobacter sp.]